MACVQPAGAREVRANLTRVREWVTEGLGDESGPRGGGGWRRHTTTTLKECVKACKNGRYSGGTSSCGIDGRSHLPCDMSRPARHALCARRVSPTHARARAATRRRRAECARHAKRAQRGVLTCSTTRGRRDRQRRIDAWPTRRPALGTGHRGTRKGRAATATPGAVVQAWKPGARRRNGTAKGAPLASWLYGGPARENAQAGHRHGMQMRQR